ncbi:hypothetical protein RCL_jg18243.t1 [Rhizophagus clarus]|uniref:Uncharacterized protein n=1 Tax=Rhizophagus clarus TaxID=94130 RepID=A0A8H3LIR3_9GLOM|nr:hypothetical protein RCL_jg18243.t1 [Rhizophagus clarus]
MQILLSYKKKIGLACEQNNKPSKKRQQASLILRQINFETGFLKAQPGLERLNKGLSPKYPALEAAFVDNK